MMKNIKRKIKGVCQKASVFFRGDSNADEIV